MGGQPRRLSRISADDELCLPRSHDEDPTTLGQSAAQWLSRASLCEPSGPPLRQMCDSIIPSEGGEPETVVRDRSVRMLLGKLSARIAAEDGFISCHRLVWLEDRMMFVSTVEDFPESRWSNVAWDGMAQYVTKKYACVGCPIACGWIYSKVNVFYA